MKNNTDLNADIDLKNQILKVFHFPDKRKNLYKVITQESDLIADCYNEDHAAFICKAVNEYDSLIEDNKRLLEALKDITDTVESLFTANEYPFTNSLPNAKEAINKSENKI